MAALDINKPLFAKVYDFDENHVEPDGADDCGHFAVQEISQIVFATNWTCRGIVREPIVWLMNGSQTHTFEILPQE